MKRCYKNKLLLAVILQLLLFANQASAQERDPFSPSGTGVMTRVRELTGTASQAPAEPQNKAFDNLNPLTSVQLSGYKVIGVIVSETAKIASVKAINGLSYTLKIGDSLGSEGGKVSEINLDEILIQTESQEIRLPVSNKAEVLVEGAAKK